MLLFVIAAQRRAEIPGHRYGLQALADIGQDGAHVPAAELGCYVNHALLILAFDKHRPAPGRGGDHIAQDDPLSVGIGDRQVQDFAQRFLFSLRQLHQDGVLVAPLAKGAGRGARQYGLEHGGDLRDRQPHVGGLGAIHDNQLFGGAGLAAHVGVRDAFHGRDHRLHPARQAVGGFQVVAAHIHLDAVFPLGAHAQNEKPLPCPRADPDAGQITQFLPQIVGNLLAGTAALVDRNQREAHFTGIAAPRVPGRSAEERHRVFNFRHRIINNRFDLFEAAFHHLQPGAHGHLRRDAHFALVGGGHQLHTHQRDQGKAPGQHDKSTGEGEPAMGQGPPQQVPVAILKARIKVLDASGQRAAVGNAARLGTRAAGAQP